MSNLYAALAVSRLHTERTPVTESCRCTRRRLSIRASSETSSETFQTFGLSAVA